MSLTERGSARMCVCDARGRVFHQTDNSTASEGAADKPLSLLGALLNEQSEKWFCERREQERRRWSNHCLSSRCDRRTPSHFGGPE